MASGADRRPTGNGKLLCDGLGVAAELQRENALEEVPEERGVETVKSWATRPAASGADWRPIGNGKLL
ncbi:hypothetical protein NDU88_005744 [Pleurodeles waltl]|uniref:Uncharacterized protein n=1 Tax=Pleurodeles waltl TaxID=8319 RepID=A0AAV7MX93_PLEWA|nr:hypothetical protein NDU88_005744 [Pleurodeles waltl]